MIEDSSSGTPFPPRSRSSVGLTHSPRRIKALSMLPFPLSFPSSILAHPFHASVFPSDLSTAVTCGALFYMTYDPTISQHENNYGPCRVQRSSSSFFIILSESGRRWEGAPSFIMQASASRVLSLGKHTSPQPPTPNGGRAWACVNFRRYLFSLPLSLLSFSDVYGPDTFL